jgi:regulatory protein
MLTVVKISQGRGPYYKVEFSNGEKLRLSERYSCTSSLA